MCFSFCSSHCVALSLCSVTVVLLNHISIFSVPCVPLSLSEKCFVAVCFSIVVLVVLRYPCVVSAVLII